MLGQLSALGHFDDGFVASQDQRPRAADRIGELDAIHLPETAMLI